MLLFKGENGDFGDGGMSACVSNVQHTMTSMCRGSVQTHGCCCMCVCDEFVNDDLLMYLMVETFCCYWYCICNRLAGPTLQGLDIIPIINQAPLTETHSHTLTHLSFMPRAALARQQKVSLGSSLVGSRNMDAKTALSAGYTPPLSFFAIGTACCAAVPSPFVTARLAAFLDLLAAILSSACCLSVSSSSPSGLSGMTLRKSCCASPMMSRTASGACARGVGVWDNHTHPPIQMHSHSPL